MRSALSTRVSLSSSRTRGMPARRGSPARSASRRSPARARVSRTRSVVSTAARRSTRWSSTPRKLDRATDLPVSVDLENPGTASRPRTLRTRSPRGRRRRSRRGPSRTTTRVTGCTRPDYAVERVAAAVEAARALDFPFMLTARAENHIRGNPALDDTIARLQAFETAGADVLYAPGLRTVDEIRAVCSSVSKPVNVLASGTSPRRDRRCGRTARERRRLADVGGCERLRGRRARSARTATSRRSARALSCATGSPRDTGAAPRRPARAGRGHLAVQRAPRTARRELDPARLRIRPASRRVARAASSRAAPQRGVARAAAPQRDPGAPGTRGARFDPDARRHAPRSGRSVRLRRTATPDVGARSSRVVEAFNTARTNVPTVSKT